MFETACNEILNQSFFERYQPIITKQTLLSTCGETLHDYKALTDALNFERALLQQKLQQQGLDPEARARIEFISESFERLESQLAKKITELGNLSPKAFTPADIVSQVTNGIKTECIKIRFKVPDISANMFDWYFTEPQIATYLPELATFTPEYIEQFKAQHTLWSTLEKTFTNLQEAISTAKNNNLTEIPYYVIKANEHTALKQSTETIPLETAELLLEQVKYKLNTLNIAYNQTENTLNQQYEATVKKALEGFFKQHQELAKDSLATYKHHFSLRLTKWLKHKHGILYDNTNKWSLFRNHIGKGSLDILPHKIETAYYQLLKDAFKATKVRLDVLLDSSPSAKVTAETFLAEAIKLYIPRPAPFNETTKLAVYNDAFQKFEAALEEVVNLEIKTNQKIFHLNIQAVLNKTDNPQITTALAKFFKAYAEFYSVMDWYPDNQGFNNLVKSAATDHFPLIKNLINTFSKLAEDALFHNDKIIPADITSYQHTVETYHQLLELSKQYQNNYQKFKATFSKVRDIYATDHLVNESKITAERATELLKYYKKILKNLSSEYQNWLEQGPRLPDDLQKTLRDNISSCKNLIQEIISHETNNTAKTGVTHVLQQLEHIITPKAKSQFAALHKVLGVALNTDEAKGQPKTESFTTLEKAIFKFLEYITDTQKINHDNHILVEKTFFGAFHQLITQPKDCFERDCFSVFEENAHRLRLTENYNEQAFSQNKHILTKPDVLESNEPNTITAKDMGKLREIFQKITEICNNDTSAAPEALERELVEIFKEHKSLLEKIRPEWFKAVEAPNPTNAKGVTIGMNAALPWGVGHENVASIKAQIKHDLALISKDMVWFEDALNSRAARGVGFAATPFVGFVINNQLLHIGETIYQGNYLQATTDTLGLSVAITLFTPEFWQKIKLPRVVPYVRAVGLALIPLIVEESIDKMPHFTAKLAHMAGGTFISDMLPQRDEPILIQLFKELGLLLPRLCAAPFQFVENRLTPLYRKSQNTKIAAGLLDPVENPDYYLPDTYLAVTNMIVPQISRFVAKQNQLIKQELISFSAKHPHDQDRFNGALRNLNENLISFVCPQLSFSAPITLYYGWEDTVITNTLTQNAFLDLVLLGQIDISKLMITHLRDDGFYELRHSLKPNINSQDDGNLIVKDSLIVAPQDLASWGKNGYTLIKAHSNKHKVVSDKIDAFFDIEALTKYLGDENKLALAPEYKFWYINGVANSLRKTSYQIGSEFTTDISRTWYNLAVKYDITNIKFFTEYQYKPEIELFPVAIHQAQLCTKFMSSQDYIVLPYDSTQQGLYRVLDTQGTERLSKINAEKLRQFASQLYEESCGRIFMISQNADIPLIQQRYTAINARGSFYETSNRFDTMSDIDWQTDWFLSYSADDKLWQAIAPKGIDCTLPAMPLTALIPQVRPHLTDGARIYLNTQELPTFYTTQKSTALRIEPEFGIRSLEVGNQSLWFEAKAKNIATYELMHKQQYELYNHDQQKVYSAPHLGAIRDYVLSTKRLSYIFINEAQSFDDLALASIHLKKERMVTRYGSLNERYTSTENGGLQIHLNNANTNLLIAYNSKQGTLLMK